MSSASYRYSLALIELALEDNVLDSVYNDFTAFIDVYNDDKDFRKLLDLDLIQSKDKKNIINKIFKKNEKNILKNFLYLLIDKDRINEVSLIYANYKKLYYKEKNTIFVTAVSAVALSEDEKKKLISKLSRKYNKKIILTEEVNNEVIGGLILYMDDEILDLSIKTKLEHLGHNLRQMDIS